MNSYIFIKCKCSTNIIFLGSLCLWGKKPQGWGACVSGWQISSLEVGLLWWTSSRAFPPSKYSGSPSQVSPATENILRCTWQDKGNYVVIVSLIQEIVTFDELGIIAGKCTREVRWQPGEKRSSERRHSLWACQRSIWSSCLHRKRKMF